MKNLNNDAAWLKRGRQRCAVAQVLRRPQTASGIWKDAVALAPKLQLRDVWFILRQLEERGLAQCFNPSLLNGKVFFWTEAGRTAAQTLFGCEIIPPAVASVNWDDFGKVMRAPIRRQVLEEISRPPLPGRRGKCAAEIRRQLRDKSPMQLSRTLRAVKELSGLKLIRQTRHTPGPRKKFYELTPAGRCIVEALKQQDQPISTQTGRMPGSERQT